MSILLDNLDPEIEAQLRARAEELRETPAEVASRLIGEALTPRLHGEALRDHLLSQPRQRDFSDLVGTWVEDPEFDAALAWHDRVVEEETPRAGLDP